MQFAAIVSESRIFSIAQCNTPICNYSHKFLLWQLQICICAEFYNMTQSFAVDIARQVAQNIA